MIEAALCRVNTLAANKSGLVPYSTDALRSACKVR